MGPAGGTFWRGNVHFHKVFKWDYLQPLVDAISLVLHANLVIRVPNDVLSGGITCNRLICSRSAVDEWGLG